MGRSFYVEIFQGRALLGGQKWRWRAVNRSNFRRLASGEAYANKQDMLRAVWLLFGEDVEIRVRTAAGLKPCTQVVR